MGKITYNVRPQENQWIGYINMDKECIEKKYFETEQEARTWCREEESKYRTFFTQILAR